MWLLPMSLRAKMALVTLLGIFFIPFATSDLRGLTHVLTCEDAVSASLYIDNPDDAETILLSADSTTREDVGLGLCGGLVVDLQITGTSQGRAELLVAITNDTDFDWQGSVELQVDKTALPIAIGSIAKGDTETDVVELRTRTGEDYEVTGTLLIGP